MNLEQSPIPSTEQLEAELNRVQRHQRFWQTLGNTLSVLAVVAAVAVLAATLWLPMLRIQGNSMAPTLSGGSIVLSVNTDNLETGDVIAFYHNNKILVKRIIGCPGDWVNITADGTVYGNNEPLEEMYLDEKSYGDCNIQMPYQVPESRYFVLGDNRPVSVDSRNDEIGCVPEDMVIGKVILSVWPLNQWGSVK